ncbi:MAG: hypothetical protein AAFQ44_05595 [Pseudomonadota bacterium]
MGRNRLATQQKRPSLKLDCVAATADMTKSLVSGEGQSMALKRR